MRTTIDSGGRVVVPKAIRAALDLRPGQELDIDLRDNRIEIDVPATAMRLRRSGGSVAAVPEEELPPLTAEQVRETLEQTRR